MASTSETLVVRPVGHETQGQSLRSDLKAAEIKEPGSSVWQTVEIGTVIVVNNSEAKGAQDRPQYYAVVKKVLWKNGEVVLLVAPLPRLSSLQPAGTQDMRWKMQRVALSSEDRIIPASSILHPCKGYFLAQECQPVSMVKWGQEGCLQERPRAGLICCNHYDHATKKVTPLRSIVPGSLLHKQAKRLMEASMAALRQLEEEEGVPHSKRTAVLLNKQREVGKGGSVLPGGGKASRPAMGAPASGAPGLASSVPKGPQTGATQSSLGGEAQADSAARNSSAAPKGSAAPQGGDSAKAAAPARSGEPAQNGGAAKGSRGDLNAATAAPSADGAKAAQNTEVEGGSTAQGGTSGQLPADGGKGAIAGKSDAAGQIATGSRKEGGASEKVVTGQHGADGGTVVAAGRSDAAEQPPSDSAMAVDAAKSAADVPNGEKDASEGKDRPGEDTPAAIPALTGDYGLPLAPVAPEKVTQERVDLDATLAAEQIERECFKATILDGIFETLLRAAGPSCAVPVSSAKAMKMRPDWELEEARKQTLLPAYKTVDRLASAFAQVKQPEAVEELTEKGMDRLLATWLVAPQKMDASLGKDSASAIISILKALLRTPCDMETKFWINHWGILKHVRTVLEVPLDIKEHARRLRMHWTEQWNRDDLPESWKKARDERKKEAAKAAARAAKRRKTSHLSGKPGGLQASQGKSSSLSQGGTGNGRTSSGPSLGASARATAPPRQPSSLPAKGTGAGPAPIKRKREEAGTAASTQQAKPQEGAPQPKAASRDAEGSKARGSSVGGPGKRRKRLEEAIGGLLQRREQSLESAGPAGTPVRKASASTELSQDSPVITAPQIEALRSRLTKEEMAHLRNVQKREGDAGAHACLPQLLKKHGLDRKPNRASLTPLRSGLTSPRRPSPSVFQETTQPAPIPETSASSPPQVGEQPSKGPAANEGKPAARSVEGRQPGLAEGDAAVLMELPEPEAAHGLEGEKDDGASSGPLQPSAVGESLEDEADPLAEGTELSTDAAGPSAGNADDWVEVYVGTLQQRLLGNYNTKQKFILLQEGPDAERGRRLSTTEFLGLANEQLFDKLGEQNEIVVNEVEEFRAKGQTDRTLEEWLADACSICGSPHHSEGLMLCSNSVRRKPWKCERMYHHFCLDPPLAAVPEGDWFCPHCVSQGRGAKPPPPKRVNRGRNRSPMKRLSRMS